MFGDSEVSTTFAAANTGVAQLVEPGLQNRVSGVRASPPVQ